MRVELRLEENEHEYAVTIECDQSVSRGDAISAAVDCVSRITGSFQPF